MAQPFRAYAKTLLEVQQYPIRRLAPGAAPDRPYDVAGWTLPLQMNVRVDRIDQYFEPPPTTRLDRATIPAGEGLGRGAEGRLLRDRRAWQCRQHRDQSAAQDRRARGVPRRATGAAGLHLSGRIDPGDGSEGRPRHRGSRSRASSGLRATATSDRAPADARPIGRARVGLYKPWVENIDEGWTRWLLEQYEFEFENIADADIKQGGLRQRFDAIVLPDHGRRAHAQRSCRRDDACRVCGRAGHGRAPTCCGSSSTPAAR